MKRSHRIGILSAFLCLCLLAPTAHALEIQPFAIAHCSADLSYSGNQLLKYGRVSLGVVENVSYTVVLQQKGIWPWADFTDYEYASGSSSNGSVYYTALTSPPKGYYYRVVVYASSSTFPHLETASAALYY